MCTEPLDTPLDINGCGHLLAVTDTDNSQKNHRKYLAVTASDSASRLRTMPATPSLPLLPTPYPLEAAEIRSTPRSSPPNHSRLRDHEKTTQLVCGATS